MFHSLTRLLMPLGLLLVLCGSMYADSAAGRVLGVLKDQNGGVVQGAKVELKSQDSSLTKSTLTDPQGRYAFDSLPAGRYQASATSPGFAAAVRNDILVTADQGAVVDLTLNLARKETVVIVTAPAMNRPLVVETDPRAPRQPIPAQDGGDYLKNIPGFSIIRKGGTDGDPVLRGMAGSRLTILANGQEIFGGCGGRMDPPTAYIYPAAFDRITVLKGPQTVLYGPTPPAGVVLFEQNQKPVERGVFSFDTAFTMGGYGRHDEMMDVRAATPRFYVQGIGVRSHSGDYRDGSGASIHSFYTRWNSNMALGWTPGENTLLELSLAKSDGRAAYADRMMDGTKFGRDNVSLRFERRNIFSWLEKIEAESYYNYVDHIMDNFSLRTPGTMFSISNPDRRTMGGRFATTLLFAEKTKLVIGTDTRRDYHRFRGASGKANADLATTAYLAVHRAADMRFSRIGLFGEATQYLTQDTRLIGGFRGDRHEAVDSRLCVGVQSCPAGSPLRNDTLSAVDTRWLMSGFGRFELDVMKHGLGTFFAGVGYTERFPDYWERLRQSPTTLKSAFLSTRTEKTAQLDAGMLWRASAFSGSVSGFYGRVNDYILIKWSPTPSLTRNVDATTVGGEADVTYHMRRNLKADAALSYVRGRNRTDNKPLAQQPPLEGRLGLSYESRHYSLGGLARLVGRQSKIDIGSGNIVSNGMDLGPTAGFAVFSLNAGFRIKQTVLITGGIDNLFDRTYAEHLSRGGAMVPGFVQLTRINEPGRTFWLRANFNNN